MRQLTFFQRLGPIGMLALLHLIGLAEAILPTLARGEEADAPLEALLFQFWVIVFNICFFLVRRYIFADGTRATGKAPALRPGCRKWFTGFSVLQFAFSMLVLGWLAVLGGFGWLAAEAVLTLIKVQLVLRGNRLFRDCGE
ncbi:hypothetical protein [Oscillibacter sp.]|uniref:hypothetical protein n=1 Tax=Oscillibacter sp. TaxID=1945593 RepID=UPI003391E26E